MPPHEMILASAGSGKTWRLAVRWIQLLRLGTPPERVVALTFSRKAAGEFLNRIVEMLCAAAGDHSAAAKTAPLPGMDPMTPEEAEQLLQGLIAAFGRLQLGTLDSFFALLLRSHPWEFGLSEEPGVIEEHEVTETVADVLDNAIGDSRGSRREAFRIAVSRLLHGRPERSVSDTLQQAVESARSLWQLCPDAARWGNASSIWSEMPADPGITPEAAAEAVSEATAQTLESRDRIAYFREKLDAIVLAARGAGLGSGETMWRYLLEVASGSTSTLTVNRKKFDLERDSIAAIRNFSESIRYTRFKI